MHIRLITIVAVMTVTQNAMAQVRCTMPNGVVIEQKLSNICPAGAKAAVQTDGSPAPIREPKLAPPSPIIKDRLWRVSQDIHKDELGADWPLLTDKGTLKCMYPVQGDTRKPALLITTNGELVYAINGTANAHAKAYGWQDIKPIWRDNHAIPGTKIPLTKLIERGHALCK